MDTTRTRIAFDADDLAQILASATGETLDELDFGVIGFDVAGVVRIYNRYETEAAGLGTARVMGRRFFADVAPCMNNFLVAQRFDDARISGASLDATMAYVLTLRMRPTRVELRLIQEPGSALSYVLVNRAVRD